MAQNAPAELIVRCLGGYYLFVKGNVRGRLPFLSFPKDVGVGAGTVERDDAYLGVFLVEQQPVGIDVAFPVALVVARQQVVMQVGGESLAILKHPNDGVQIAQLEASTLGQFQILAERAGWFDCKLCHRVKGLHTML